MGQKILRKINILQTYDDIRRFWAVFGVSPSIFLLAWRFIAAYGTIPSGWMPHHLLWGLLFLKVYVSEDIHVQIVGEVTRKTFQKRSWESVRILKEIEANVFENRYIGTNGSACLMSVDCTDFLVHETAPFCPDFFSYKLKHAALRYEIGVSIQRGDIVWINGPFLPRDWPDITIF